MCTDVDRNDKSRVCVAGSVKVIGRRQIEMYSRLIHTVDHVEGKLRPEFDALDGFLSHAWAVTVTGAPKLWAIRFIEEQERSARRWYGGAIGRLTFDGNMNTGLTLRTIRMQDGIAEVRAGATLLYDSDPVAEEDETPAQGGGAVRRDRAATAQPAPAVAAPTPASRARAARCCWSITRIRSSTRWPAMSATTGAEVHDAAPRFRARRACATGRRPISCVLSPGPGRPDDFAMGETLDLLLERAHPDLRRVSRPAGDRRVFRRRARRARRADARQAVGRCAPCRQPAAAAGCRSAFTVGRYHSLYARRERLAGGVVGRGRDRRTASSWRSSTRTLPIAAVQFHPESVMTSPGEIGMPIIAAALAGLAKPA